MHSIRPIVECHGEVAAVPVLLRRLTVASGLSDSIQVSRPIHCKRHRLVKEESFRAALRLAVKKPDSDAVLVLFDSDDDCPKDLAPKLRSWATDEVRGRPFEIVMAHREYEAWFVAAVESLRGRRGVLDDATAPAEPESIRGAKEALEERMRSGRAYKETSDQAAFSAVFDMAAAYSCRSFRHLVTAYGRIAAALGCGIPQWPPADWEKSTS